MDQETYQAGRTLRLSPWTESQLGWDHNQCAVCWTKIAEGDNAYVTANDNHHWIFPGCFEDFRTEFAWTVVPAQDDS
jgi:hypothetical protein